MRAPSILFTDVTEATGLRFHHTSGSSGRKYVVETMGSGAAAFDYDADGNIDLYVVDSGDLPGYAAAADPRNALLRNEGPGSGWTFTDRATTAGVDDRGYGMGVTIGDYDNDLDADVLVTNINGAPDLLRNDSEPRLPALQVRLVGRAANRMGYGARVLVRSGEDVQVLQRSSGDGYLGSNDVRLLIYLPSGRADELRVQWGAGEETILTDVTPGRIVVDQARGVVARRN